MIKRFLYDFCSPRGLALRALALALFFGVCHLFRWRVHTSFISGTLEAEGAMRGLAPLFGLIYIFAHLLATVIAPILLLAAALLAAGHASGSRLRIPANCHREEERRSDL